MLRQICRQFEDFHPPILTGVSAGHHEISLPQPFRYFTRGLGIRGTKSPDSLSLLLFQPDCLHYLVELGERDTRRHAGEIEEFLRTSTSNDE